MTAPARRGPRRLPWPRLAAATRTVRFRTTAVATLVVLAVLVVAGAGLVRAQQTVLTANLDMTLDQRVATVTALIAGGSADDLGSPSDESVIQIQTTDGRVVAGGAGGSAEQPLVAAEGVGRDAVFTTLDGIPGVDDEAFRTASRRVETADGERIVTVAQGLDDVAESTHALAASLLVVVPAIAAVLATLTWVLIGKTLQPVESLRSAADEISGADLTRRVPRVDADDEIGRLARTLNRMLDRIEHAVGRQQQFVADASHELRTPITRIRSELEVDLEHPDHTDLLRTHRRVLVETVGLQQLVEDLLHLARSDAHALVRRRVVVDLDDLVFAAAGQVHADGAARVDVRGVSPVRVLGDPAHLGRAINNLADNAARHAARVVVFTLSRHGASAIATIADDGPGIPPDRRDDVFERFVRLDDARGNESGGSGLGLAITREIIERHGGTVIVDPAERMGTRIIVTLPATG